ncbi:MAG TPA: flagellar biosynthetic protein FliQ [Phycisphaerae bacterium]|nr:flagellar biosynthetic protein FliQ [Phycisphaerae bacterium]
MEGTLVLYIARRMMETALLLAGPALAVTLVTGFLVAMIQAVTSIRDMSMGMVVKLAGVAVTLLICGGWMLEVASEFMMEIFNHMQALGH